ncbi:MAG: ligA, partial [Clostridiaceae bacterium]|nr:ligA [Clostridiaceae bacterium]
LEPVELAGVTVKRATLNNMDDIARKGVRIGAEVFVRLSVKEILSNIIINIYNKSIYKIKNIYNNMENKLDNMVSRLEMRGEMIYGC